MPKRTGRPCTTPGCPNLQPCPTHARKPWQDSKRSGSTRSWRKVRETILRRDPICKLCGQNPSTVCDHHPITRAQGGSDEQWNLRGICSPCDRTLSAAQGGQAARRRHDMPAAQTRGCLNPRCPNLVQGVAHCASCQPAKVTLVSGSPCSGKSSYVRAHAQPRDLIIDHDALAAALSIDTDPHGQSRDVLRPFIAEIREAILTRLARGNHDIEHAWIIRGAPTRGERAAFRNQFPTASVLIVETPQDVCRRRAQAERPLEWSVAVDRWFSEYEPDPRDERAPGA